MNRYLKTLHISFYTAAILFLFPLLCTAQQKDTLDLKKAQHLDRVILTGQYNPQSVNQSVFEVEVIPQDEIQRLAGNSLEDVLTQTLNLNVIPNPGEGRSGIQQFGFGSDYVKILVDGIPVIGDEGFGNSIDVTQINLDDIAQIEIIEGSMGVQYGSDAVTGVINIITKKQARHNWQIIPYIQEETVGSEYGLFDEGRHIQAIKAGHKISPHWYAEAGYTHNDFRGYKADKKGKHYYNPDKGTDEQRGYEWLPKEQHTLKGLLNYDNHVDFKAFYKFEYFEQELNKYAHRVNLNRNPATETVNPTALDIDYRTQRLYHHLNASGKLFQQLNFNLSNSFQEQKLNQEQYTYTLMTGEKSNINRFDYNTRKGFFSRGTLNSFFDSETLNLEAGYEFNHDEGMVSGLSEQNKEDDSQKHTINTFSGFISSEIKLSPRLSLRPGVRMSVSSKFDDQYAFSFSGKYEFKNNYQLRAVVGTSPKSPTFEQLYYYLIDANHDIRGDENLIPEKGKSVFLHLKKTFHDDSYTLVYTPKLSAWYLDVKDKIDLIVASTSPLQYRYSNINSFRNWGVSLRNQLDYQHVSLSLGAALSGQSKEFRAEDQMRDDFLYSVQLNAKAAYRVPEWQTVFSVFFKYNGPSYEFIQNASISDSDPEVIKGKQHGFGWLNASVRKQFFDRRFEVTLGARNLLDVNTVKTSAIGSGAHSAAPSGVMLGYGRSYFLKLLYNLNF